MGAKVETPTRTGGRPEIWRMRIRLPVENGYVVWQPQRIVKIENVFPDAESFSGAMVYSVGQKFSALFDRSNLLTECVVQFIATVEDQTQWGGVRSAYPGAEFVEVVS